MKIGSSPQTVTKDNPLGLNKEEEYGFESVIASLLEISPVEEKKPDLHTKGVATVDLESEPEGNPFFSAVDAELEQAKLERVDLDAVERKNEHFNGREFFENSEKFVFDDNGTEPSKPSRLELIATEDKNEHSESKKVFKGVDDLEIAEGQVAPEKLEQSKLYHSRSVHVELENSQLDRSAFNPMAKKNESSESKKVFKGVDDLEIAEGKVEPLRQESLAGVDLEIDRNTNKNNSIQMKTLSDEGEGARQESVEYVTDPLEHVHSALGHSKSEPLTLSHADLNINPIQVKESSKKEESPESVDHTVEPQRRSYFGQGYFVQSSNDSGSSTNSRFSEKIENSRSFQEITVQKKSLQEKPTNEKKSADLFSDSKEVKVPQIESLRLSEKGFVTPSAYGSEEENRVEIKKFAKIISDSVNKMLSFEEKSPQRGEVDQAAKNQPVMIADTEVVKNTAMIDLEEDVNLEGNSKSEASVASPEKKKLEVSGESVKQSESFKALVEKENTSHGFVSDSKGISVSQREASHTIQTKDAQVFDHRLNRSTHETQVSFIKEGALYRGAKIEIQHPELGRIQFELKMKERSLDLKVLTKSFKAARLVKSIESSVRSEMTDANIDLRDFKIHVNEKEGAEKKENRRNTTNSSLPNQFNTKA